MATRELAHHLNLQAKSTKRLEFLQDSRMVNLPLPINKALSRAYENPLVSLNKAGC